MQIARSAISGGTAVSPRLTQAYTAFGLAAVICQNGSLMIPGVL